MSARLNRTITYRQEVLSRVFGYIQSTESFYLVGAASVGKTRLIDHLTLSNVREYYLTEEEAKRTWIVRVDLNRLVTKEDIIFSFFELMLSSLLQECSRQTSDEFESIKNELAPLDSDVIESRDPLRAVRFLELAITRLCQVRGYKICFLFDEFDDAYKNFPREIFALLRGIRDANKPYLCYALFLRALPEKLRKNTNKGNDIESFYELLSRNLIGIGPYSKEDTLGIVRDLLERYRHSLKPEYHEWVATVSGGHIGLVQALLNTLIDNPDAVNHLKDISWFAKQEAIAEECRKIWEGLTTAEQAGLKALTQGTTELPYLTLKLLHAKGLLNSETNAFFSPLFELYVKSM